MKSEKFDGGYDDPPREGYGTQIRDPRWVWITADRAGTACGTSGAYIVLRVKVRTLLIASALAVGLVHCSSSNGDGGEETEKIVESRAGSLVITTPERGAFIEGDGATEVQVIGKGAAKGLEINGAPVDVDDEGNFRTTLKPAPGMNLVVATSGASRLERPFLFGHFVSPETMVDHAIAIDLGARGISAPLPSASLESVANLALENRNLVSSLAGKTFSGSMTAADWTFTVSGGDNGTGNLRLQPLEGGLGVNGSIQSVVVDGRITLTSLGATVARDVRITVDSANVSGDLELSLDAQTGAVKAAMPNATAKLEGFHFDTDNAGLWCCVDWILTSVIAGKVEEAVQTGLKDQLPSLMALTLDGLGVPKEIDYAIAGAQLKFPMKTRFDSLKLDQGGAFISAAALFGGKAAPGTPGARAPGWLSFGGDYAQPKAHVPVLGVSFSIDALNQLMFAAWGSGSLAYTAPAPLNAKLSPAMPPLVSLTDGGALRISLAEILIQRAGAAKPLGAVSVIQDVKATTDGDALLLAPEGKATISITWLTDDREGSGKDLVASAAKSQLEKFLQPFRVPVPKFALDRLGGGFVGRSLAFGSPEITFEKATSRVAASGRFHFAAP